MDLLQEIYSELKNFRKEHKEDIVRLSDKIGKTNNKISENKLEIGVIKEKVSVNRRIIYYIIGAVSTFGIGAIFSTLSHLK